MLGLHSARLPRPVVRGCFLLDSLPVARKLQRRRTFSCPTSAPAIADADSPARSVHSTRAQECLCAALYVPHFAIGAAIEPGQLSTSTDAALRRAHYNGITAENAMKADTIAPSTTIRNFAAGVGHQLPAQLVSLLAYRSSAAPRYGAPTQGSVLGSRRHGVRHSLTSRRWIQRCVLTHGIFSRSVALESGY